LNYPPPRRRVLATVTRVVRTAGEPSDATAFLAVSYRVLAEGLGTSATIAPVVTPPARRPSDVHRRAPHRSSIHA